MPSARRTERPGWRPGEGGRYGQGDEVSEAIVFIASDAPRDITGENLRVAGGITRSV